MHGISTSISEVVSKLFRKSLFKDLGIILICISRVRTWHISEVNQGENLTKSEFSKI